MKTIFSTIFVLHFTVVTPKTPRIETDTSIRSFDAIEKALGQNCSTTLECTKTLLCIKGLCQCGKNFTESRGLCVKAPTFNEKCSDLMCADPFVCTSKKCVCPPGMTFTKNSCVCDHGEIAFGKKCLKTFALGQPCEIHRQCRNSFTHCFKGKCDCIGGAKKDKNSCILDFKCPNEKPPVKNKDGSLVKCRTYENPQSNVIDSFNEMKNDNCTSEDHFCAVPTSQHSFGFCCPVKSHCPYGKALKGKSCADGSKNGISSDQCPIDTHFCYENSSCCPLPCPSLPSDQKAVIFNNTCYSVKNYLETCQLSIQCPLNAECQNSRCQCKNGFGPMDINQATICAKLCKPNEVFDPYSQQCLEKVTPLNQCKSWMQCTQGMTCRNGICQCPIGQIMYDSACLSIQGVCHNFSYGAYDPQIDKDGRLVQCTPDATEKSYEKSLLNEQKNACDSFYYCHPNQKIRSEGVCCPIPASVCGKKLPRLDEKGQTVRCNDKNDKKCSKNEFCQMQIVEDADKVVPINAGVCCPRSSS